jgi:uncharacterized protein
MIRVLSIDGGGIRGVIPATILVALEERIQDISGNPNARLIDYFDFLAGTSTGGIITAILNTPISAEQATTPKYSTKDVISFYQTKGSSIFKARWLAKLFGSIGLADEKYSARSLEEILHENLGESWLSNLMKPCLIPAYNLEQGRTYFFCPHDHQSGKKEAKDFMTRDVCRATSAAPSYFEPARIRNAESNYSPFIDGGVFANNPTLCAMAEVGKAKGAFSPNEMFILSLGTGRVQMSYSFNRWKKAIALLIVPELINIMMDGVSETTHFITRKLFDNLGVGNQYVRLDPILNDTGMAQMDNVKPSNIAKLQELGRQVVAENDAEITRIAQTLIDAGVSTRRGVVAAPGAPKLEFLD